MSLTFAAFAAANRERCEKDFKRELGTQDAIISMIIGLSEEAGEVAGAVRASLGISERKQPSIAKVGEEIADLVSYADLLAQSHGLNLEDVLITKFNRVSERIGSTIRLGLHEVPPITLAEVDVRGALTKTATRIDTRIDEVIKRLTTLEPQTHPYDWDGKGCRRCGVATSAPHAPSHIDGCAKNTKGDQSIVCICPDGAGQ